MKLKKIIILSVAFCSLMTTQNVSALISDSQLSTLISEPSFRACVLDTYNSVYTDPNESSSTSQISNNLSKIPVLDCNNKNITSTEGIQYLTALTELYLGNNNISTIDLSKNTSLTFLYLSYNKIGVIDLSKNIALKTLYLSNNKLSTIDVSKNTKLTKLYLYDNKLTKIDVSKNTSLETLYLSDNDLSTIDVSKNTALTGLSLNDNDLSTINLSKNASLIDLYLSNNKLSTIDVSKNASLKILYLLNNKLTSIDLSKNTKLTILYLKDNNFSQPTGTKYNLGKLAVGEKVNFKEYVKLPQGFKTKVSYTSSNPEIATVDENGNISGVKEGTTTITFTSNDKGGNLIYEVNEVTVTKKVVSEKTNNDKIDVKNPKTSDKGMIYGGGLTLTIGTIIAIRKKLKLLGI